VYALDLHGHGARDWSGPYTIEQLATDPAAFLDALELEQVALGGHSVGGPPAYLRAARQPGRVTRLILEDPAPPWPRGPRVLARPEGPLPFDWDVTALSNEFIDPQASSWREELRRIQARALLIAGGPASHVDQGQLAGMAALIPDCELVTIPAGRGPPGHPQLHPGVHVAKGRLWAMSSLTFRLPTSTGWKACGGNC
jgi:3-oxoadipate enol-lactonase